MRRQLIAAPLCMTIAFLLALNANVAVAAGADDFTSDGVKLRGDGTVDDTQPGLDAGDDADGEFVGGVKRRGDGSIDDTQPRGAAPDVKVETTTNSDGTTTVTRSVTLQATGAAPQRSRSMEMTFDADGALTSRTRSDVRTNADGVVVREKTTTLERIDGETVRTRTDIRRSDAGEILSRGERAEKTARPEKAERTEKAERAEKVERIEKAQRPEKAERVEKVERGEKVERSERPERSGRS